MKGPIRSAVIGCGKVGHTHAQALKSLPGSDFVAACDPLQERADDFAAKYGVRAYTDPEAMFRAETVQMVSICTPHPSHAEMVEVCARHGAHVLVEKPLAPDLTSCDRAISACRIGGVKLGVVSQRRLYEPVVRMHRAIADGAIGTPILAILTVLGWRDESYYSSDPWRGRWDSEGGGVMVNQTPHQLDLLQWLMGPIAEVYGYWDNFNHPYIEVEDTAAAIIKFASGAMGTVVVSNSQRPGLYGRLHIHGSNGASVGVQTDGGSPFIAGVSQDVEPPLNDLWTVPGQESLLEVWRAEDRARAASHDVMTHYHLLQIADYLSAIAEDRMPMVDGEEGRKVVEMITAVYRSQRDQRPIRFPVASDSGGHDYDGRLSYVPFSRKYALTPHEGPQLTRLQRAPILGRPGAGNRRGRRSGPGHGQRHLRQ
ncbi:MAG: Gfo/Idh/MocA family protein [Acidimicrobiia bacterium]